MRRRTFESGAAGRNLKKIQLNISDDLKYSLLKKEVKVSTDVLRDLDSECASQRGWQAFAGRLRNV